MPVPLDLNSAVFQEQWFSLEKDDRVAVLKCCRKVAGMEWNEIFRDKGLRWELIQSFTSPEKEQPYSIRMRQQIRAVVRRSGDFLEFLTLHSDHDSA